MRSLLAAGGLKLYVSVDVEVRPDTSVAVAREPVPSRLCGLPAWPSTSRYLRWRRPFRHPTFGGSFSSVAPRLTFVNAGARGGTVSRLIVIGWFVVPPASWPCT